MFTGLTSPTHLVLLLVIILLLFGANRLPEMGRSIAEGIREFKGGLNTGEEPVKKEEHPEAIEEENLLSAEAAQKEGEPQKRETTA